MSKVGSRSSADRRGAADLRPRRQLAADTELPVKNGAELLDRLIKDIVTEQASTYVSANAIAAPMSPQASSSVHSADPANAEHEKQPPQPERAFSLARFIPLLRERIYVLNPFTRTYLVSWLTVLDSVPELELVSFLPDFLDGLLKFLGDPTVDIRTATQNVLADFLREIREVAEVQKSREEDWRRREEERDEAGSKANSRRASQLSVGETMTDGERVEEEDSVEHETAILEEEEPPLSEEDDDYEEDLEGSGEWVPGQGVHVDHAAIVEILLEHLSFPGEPTLCCSVLGRELTRPARRRGDPIHLSAVDRRVPALRSAHHGTLRSSSHPRHPLLPRPPRRNHPHCRQRHQLQPLRRHPSHPRSSISTFDTSPYLSRATRQLGRSAGQADGRRQGRGHPRSQPHRFTPTSLWPFPLRPPSVPRPRDCSSKIGRRTHLAPHLPLGVVAGADREP